MPFPTDDAIEDEDFNIYVCGSLNKNQKVMDELFRAVDPINIVWVAGSGNKFVYMLD